jgi:hypothetical protein
MEARRQALNDALSWSKAFGYFDCSAVRQQDIAQEGVGV